MKTDLLKKHIKEYQLKIESDKISYEKDKSERVERSRYYKNWTSEKIDKMTEEQFYEFVSQLWAMLIYGAIKNMLWINWLQNNSPKLKNELNILLWSDEPVRENRWNRFRSKIKGMGPAMMSELLCHMFILSVCSLEQTGLRWFWLSWSS